ncbi:MAG: hypothetical protein AAFP04_05540 [Myxococcota bacterium]
MTPMMQPLSTLLPLTVLALTLGAACTDDVLSTSEEPASKFSSDELSPLETGDYGYFISAAYRPEANSDTAADTNQGTLRAERAIRELSAHLCVSVSTIRDTARLEFAEAEETVLEGELRLTGITSDSLTVRNAFANVQSPRGIAPGDPESTSPSDLTDRESVEQHPTTADAAAQPASSQGRAEPETGGARSSRADPGPETLDTALAPLWIKRIVAPQSECIPTEQPETFFLEQGLRPTITLDRLAFMEVRALEDWHGWDDTVSDSLAWFQEPPLSLRTNSFFDDTVIDFDHSEGPTGYGFTMVWREDGTTLPAALAGAVVHSLRVEYGADGVLTHLGETIVPDLEPTSSLDAASADLSCIDGEPCLTAVVQNEAFERLHCRF